MIIEIMTDGEVDTTMIDVTTDKMTGMTTDVVVTTMTEEMTDTMMIEEEATTITTTTTTTGTTPTIETTEMVVTTEGTTKTEKEILMKRGLRGIEAMLLLRSRKTSKIRIKVNHRVLV